MVQRRGRRTKGVASEHGLRAGHVFLHRTAQAVIVAWPSSMFPHTTQSASTNASYFYAVAPITPAPIYLLYAASRSFQLS